MTKTFISTVPVLQELTMANRFNDNMRSSFIDQSLKETNFGNK
jgi:hypothetical protein